MTYQDLLERLRDIPEEYLYQDVEVTGDCVVDDYYEVDLKFDDDDYTPVQSIKTVAPLTHNGVSYSEGRLMRWRRARKAKQVQEMRKLTEISTSQESILMDALD